MVLEHLIIETEMLSIDGEVRHPRPLDSRLAPSGPTAGLTVAEVSELVLQMEDLLQWDQALVRAAALQANEERGHLGLPASVDVGAGHAGQRGLQVVGPT